MKKNELMEIKKMDLKSLKERAKKLAQELVDLRIDKNIGKLANLKTIKNKRKDLSQTLTVLRQKELLEELQKANEK